MAQLKEGEGFHDERGSIDLPLLVARDEGSSATGLDVEILKTPGSGQRNSNHQAAAREHLRAHHGSALDRAQCDQFRMCEWA